MKLNTPGQIKFMKSQKTSVGTNTDSIRAGIISLLIFAIFYLSLTGLTNPLRVWLFIVVGAVCFTLMLKSVVELLVRAFCFVARYSGIGIGRTVRLLRRT